MFSKPETLYQDKIRRAVSSRWFKTTVEVHGMAIGLGFSILPFRGLGV